MGGGDLNMKKSWHPLLMQNQERVWLKEKQALEERKKLDQLRKEKDEERQLQELQRLQEEQTGRKRTEKLEWMYATPATGTGASSSELEEYLLGKKRVDKLLTGDENQNLGASNKNFIAVQNANSIRDTAMKIREDPLFAIKQQEQNALQALMANPLRLKELQKRNAFSSKDQEEKKKKKKKKEKKSERHDEVYRKRSSRSRSPVSRGRSHKDTTRSREHRRSESPVHGRHDGYRDKYPSRRGRSSSSSRTHSSTDPFRSGSSYDIRYTGAQKVQRLHMSDRTHSSDSRNREPGPFTNTPRNRDSPRRRIEERREDSDYGISSNTSRHVREHSTGQKNGEPTSDRAARLAAMSSNASIMNEERKARLEQLLIQEKTELELEARARAKSNGTGSFIRGEQRRVFGGLEGGLGEHMRRGKVGMVMDAD